MHLLFNVCLFVIVLHGVCRESVFSSNNPSVKTRPQYQFTSEGQTKVIANVDERLRGLANTNATHSNITLSRTPNVSDTRLLAEYGYGDMAHQHPCFVLYTCTDIIVNCTGMSLRDIRSTWFPVNTTVILLDNNHITEVDNTSLQSLTQLRHLSLSNNKIERIQEHAFSGLKNLITLNLQSNKLNERAYPPRIFDPLRRLNNLFLSSNKQTDNIPGKLFRKLANLEWLTLDAAGETLFFDNVLTNVTRLAVTGNVRLIDHTSFTSFPHTCELAIASITSLENFTDMALHPLQSLDVLTLHAIHIGIRKSLQILKPLTGKNMTSITFNYVHFVGKSVFVNFYNNEGILNAEKTQYLRKICVKHLSLIKSHIYAITMNAISGPVLNNCLRSIDLSHNHINGNGFAFYVVYHLKRIEVVNIADQIRSCYTKDSFFNDKEERNTEISGRIQAPTYHNPELLAKRETVCPKRDNDETLIKIPRQHQNQKTQNNLAGKSASIFSDFVFRSEGAADCPVSISSEGKSGESTLRVYVSKYLAYVAAKEIADFASLNDNLVVVGGSSFRYLDLRDNGLHSFTGNIIGFNNLETFLLSGNNASILSETFFDGMCHLIELDLANCHLDAHFMSNQSARIFQNLLDLKRVDLSANALNTLNPATFASNRLIEEFDFSKNRFRNIPFNLGNTPKLKLLDLQDNSLTTLESHEIVALDSLATQPAGIRLLISGNILSCGCNNFRFLIWLQTTTVSLDVGRNFTCMNDEGQLSFVRDVTDLEALWRKCWGRTFLSISLILVCSMSSGFALVFLIWKNKTFITSKILLILTGYNLMKPHDYPNGVFIGYAENDYNFPCFVLRKFIEEELHLTTYTYHRDNIPNRDRASSIVDAINASWRIILVVSDNFLCNDDWAMFTTRTALYGLSPANPARVVVLVLENLRHRLPQEVLCSVPEENIRVLSSWGISYCLKECLRTRLLEL